MRLLAAWDWHRFTKFDVWGVLFWVNAIALLALLIVAVVSISRDKQDKPAANTVAFLADDELETFRLERVLGWALVFSAILAVSYGVYWLREPSRQHDSDIYFAEGAIERGEELFANESFEVYNSAKSLKCADCHGGPGIDADLGREVVGGGGSAPYTHIIDPDNAFSVSWSAPALNTVMYRFSPEEVREIITYGRPGTPMQAWGTDGDGPKNAQSVTDLVAYIASIQISPDEAQGKIAANLKAAQEQSASQVKSAEEAVAAATEALDEAQTASDEIKDQESNEGQLAIRKVEAAAKKLEVAQAKLDWAKEWADKRSGISDGQLLFEMNCARCHTKNWSLFNPSNPYLRPETLLGPAGGGGNTGFSLVNVEKLRFNNGLDAEGKPDPTSGWTSHNLFVTNGSNKQKPYGNGGSGSGRMPGQCNTDFFASFDILEHSGCMLTTVQIEAIVAYERCGLLATLPDHSAAKYDTDCDKP